MQKFRYLLGRMRRMDYAAMVRTAKLLHQKTGLPVIWLFFDMIRCAVRYGAGYIDYKIAEMYRLTPAQRATQITRAASNRIVASMNDKAYWHHFDDKAAFNALFSAQVNRGWIDLRKADQDDLTAWAEGRGDLIGKPIDGSSGNGILKYERGALPPLADIRAEGIELLEDCVRQHPDLAALCPTSVNTLRIATLLGDKKEGIVYAYIRIGNGNVMDNVDQGGMAAPIDLSTGRIAAVGADKQGRRFETHPMTGAKIPGTQIPFWDEAKRMCLEAMRVIPQVRFVAWDVAVTPDGPVFIEGNSFPSHAIPQFAAHYPDGVGILPRFREFIEV
ncbi:MAG: hypothetical protein LBN04_12630 [Oscillospiraceae bacterium]|jgi:glutathione synthase/RimK-type ligase-like ATP-grasp enzyme|nr:hypothetical protein [Oscillospiraceae bacterium]